jgi:hypothetical protein
MIKVIRPLIVNANYHLSNFTTRNEEKTGIHYSESHSSNCITSSHTQSIETNHICIEKSARQKAKAASKVKKQDIFLPREEPLETNL